MTFEEYLAKVNEMSNEYPAWRYGQVLFNVLYHERFELSEKIRKSHADPFYFDDRIAAALEWIEANWSV